MIYVSTRIRSLRSLMNNRYASAILCVIWATAFAQMTAAAGNIELSVQFPPDRMLVGEPLEVGVELRLSDLSAGPALVTSKSFLEVRVFDEAGGQLETPPGSRELYHDVGEDRPWQQGTIILDQTTPSWSTSISLPVKFDLSTPGAYTIVVSWGTPAIMTREEEKELESISAKHGGRKDLRLLTGLVEERRQTTEIRCPDTEIDRGAYRLLVDGDCPNAGMGMLSFRLAEGNGELLLSRYPTSRYSGYALAKQISPLPGVGNDPADKIRQLTDPGFFLRFPTTCDRRTGAAEGARLAMEEEVRRAAKLRREFLDVHPDFPLRARLEKQLGDLELVLGNYERAHTAWKWVADHTTENVEWARGMLQAMEAQKLVVVPDEKDSPSTVAP